MLERPQIRGLHDRVCIGLVKEYPDDRRLRNGLVDAFLDCVKPWFGEDLRRKARSIVGIDAKKSTTQQLSIASRYIDCKIPTLRITSDQELRIRPRRESRKIVGGVPLGGHGYCKGHVEIFLPPGQGLIGPTGGDTQEIGAEDVGVDSKLSLLCIVNTVSVKILMDQTEAWARRYYEGKPLAPSRVPYGPEEAGKALGAQEIANFDVSLGGRFGKVGQDVEIGGPGQNRRTYGHEILGRDGRERAFYVIHDVFVGSHGVSDLPRPRADSSAYR